MTEYAGRMNEKHVLSIIETFGASDIAEIEISEGNFSMSLRKAAAFVGRNGASSATGTPQVPPSLPDVAASSPVAAVASENAPENGRLHLSLPVSGGEETIDSPIVGTFYAAATPDAPPFVRPGSKVKAGESLCILEAMKMMNHLEAEFDCEVSEVLAANGELVEYGQPLFRIRRG